MSKLSITTVKDLCQPIGRPGYAFDFPFETSRINPEDLRPLVGQKVYIQTNGGDFDFINKEWDGSVTITDISATKLYVKAQRKKTFQTELVEVPFDVLTLIEWSEKIVKRVVVNKGAREGVES